MRAKGVRVHAAPTRVRTSRSLVAWANAIEPVILVGETAAGPTQDGDTQFLQRREHIVTDAARIRDGRAFSDPDSFVNQTPKVFGKLSIDVAIDNRSRLVQTDGQGCLIGILCVGGRCDLRRHRPHQQCDQYQSKQSSMHSVHRSRRSCEGVSVLG